jgi:hypothetical protein
VRFLTERPSYHDVSSRYWAFGYEAETSNDTSKVILWNRQDCNVFLYANNWHVMPLWMDVFVLPLHSAPSLKMGHYDAAIQNSWSLLVRIWKGTWCEGDVGRSEAINCKHTHTHTQHTLIQGLESRVWYMCLSRSDRKRSRIFHGFRILSRPVIPNLLQLASHHSKNLSSTWVLKNSFLKINVRIIDILLLLLETLNNLRIVTFF